jgi:nitrogen fixation NifU-like protein
MASASLMTEFVKGKTLAQVSDAFERFHDLVTGPPGEAASTGELGKLAVFAGVREFPMRVKCATLSWHTLNAALEGSDEPAKTE